jgi:transcriptional regulator with XRE-family HTH domain
MTNQRSDTALIYLTPNELKTDKTSLAEYIKALRERDSISQELLAKVMGVSVPVLQGIENGEVKLLQDIEIERLADFFKKPQSCFENVMNKALAPQPQEETSSIKEKSVASWIH